MHQFYNSFPHIYKLTLLKNKKEAILLFCNCDVEQL